MKKLGKLSINQSKLLKNEELVNLRGGYDPYNPNNNTNCCYCLDANGYSIGVIGATTYDSCAADCVAVYGSSRVDSAGWFC